MLVNKYKPVWERLEHSTSRPDRVRDVIQMDYQEIKGKILTQADGFVQRVVDSLYRGDAYLIKGAFPKEFIVNMKERVHDWWQRTPPEFHKILEGSPDFHRIIDLETLLDKKARLTIEMESENQF